MAATWKCKCGKTFTNQRDAVAHQAIWAAIGGAKKHKVTPF